MSTKLTAFLKSILVASSSAGVPRVISRLVRSIVKKLVRFGVLRRNGYTLSVYGVWLIDRWDDVTFKFCASGSYGFFYSDWIEKLDESIFIDIGSNQGLYALIAAKNPNVKNIYAFEPQPEIFSRLEKNIERNNANKIKAFQYAISNTSEEQEMQVRDGHSGAATMRGAISLNDRFVRSIRIVTVNKDFLDSTIKLAGNEKIYVKIDTEGHEAQVLLELMKTRFWKNVVNIFYEVDERYIDNIKILESLKDSGFSVIYQNGSKPHYDLMLERSTI